MAVLISPVRSQVQSQVRSPVQSPQSRFYTCPDNLGLRFLSKLPCAGLMITPDNFRVNIPHDRSMSSMYGQNVQKKAPPSKKHGVMAKTVARLNGTSFVLLGGGGDKLMGKENLH